MNAKSLTIRIVQLKCLEDSGELLRRHRIAHYCVALRAQLCAVALHVMADDQQLHVQKLPSCRRGSG